MAQLIHVSLLRSHTCNVYTTSSYHLRSKEPAGENQTARVGQTTRRAQPAKYGQRWFPDVSAARRSHL